MKKALILWKGDIPQNSDIWWRTFDLILAPRAFEAGIRAGGLSYEALEDWTDSANIADAAAFLGELACVSGADGTRVSESVVYRGYQLWWMHYDELYYRHCLPYIQYRRLLSHLRNFESVTLHQSPSAAIFRFYLEAHGCHVVIHGAPKNFPSIGMWLQVLISLMSWPLLLLKRPALMMYTGDRFDPPRDHSFRMRYIYEELYQRKISFVEFIRSLEPARTVLSHGVKRRRPVIYSYAIKNVLVWFAGLWVTDVRSVTIVGDPHTTFKLNLASMYLRNAKGTIWAIKAMNLLCRSIGIRAALIPAASSRTSHEVLGCRLAGIPTIGILHGAASKYFNVYDFMPEYRGEQRLSLDVYGVWSAWWKEYYVKNGKAYTPDQLQVSGPMRPLQSTKVFVRAFPVEGVPIKVLIVPGELSAPEQILPYLHALLEAKDISLFLTFRPYHDAFEQWLRENMPDLTEKIGKERIFHGRGIQQDIAECDVVVGAYSTAVLEALLQLKPIVFFDTPKWGDYFDMKDYHRSQFFAENPKELLARIKESRHASSEKLKSLQERFFGDPYQNGSAWLVDQLQKNL